ncbi:MAG: aspartate--ammonia ligase [Clostridia bacterium]|nr:aspartate--ammonia ligase [Clostridia bacterium]
MSSLIIPEGYRSRMDLYRTQKAISFIKAGFQARLAEALDLRRVSAPLFVTEGSGLNDNLSGKERPVSFDIPDVGETGQVVHSLAKWKRLALKEYGFYVGRGLYTDMNAIRRDEELDNIHSIYVDQWDWEKVITEKERSLDYLIEVAEKIVNAICDTHESLLSEFPELEGISLKKELYAITSEELLGMYPDLTAKERENEICRERGTVLIMQIGGRLSNGEMHDGRAPDYDDWELNGDILFYNPLLDSALEISSMGIRVDGESMKRQLEERGCPERASLPFHSMLLKGELPLTVGGGIGQSRLCMLMMGCAHIGEVQSSIWDRATREGCKESGIRLL